MNDTPRPTPNWDAFEAKAPWWAWIWLGVIFVLFAGFMYYLITDIVEYRGETMQVHVVVAWAYNLMGKWGVVGLIGSIAALNIGLGIWLGIRKWRKSVEPD